VSPDSTRPAPAGQRYGRTLATWSRKTASDSARTIETSARVREAVAKRL
jgi:hypothetical protein